uniref:Putative NAC domain-containing protein 94 n=1 Tax=Anthurium amnicola TaxID=1678845 RepID=A0A1D1Y9N0_9ARAE
METSWSELGLPGFRFHPTEEELLDFYLKGAVHGKKLEFEIIPTINLYRYNPWELPGLARNGEREWYFFVPRDRRNNSGGRPNRTTERGFWKATGSDRPIRSVSDPKRLIGLKKTLVFYEGRAPRGSRTDWVMNEYRLPDDAIATTTTTSASPHKEEIVLCKIYRKATSMKELEQRAAMEEDATASRGVASTADTFSSSSCDQEIPPLLRKPPALPLVEMEMGIKEMKVETEAEKDAEVTSVPLPPSNPAGKRTPPELEALQVPPKFGFDWTQDPILMQLRSPWLDPWSPFYTNALNL